VKKPLVTVLICSYNAEQFIESTVASVLGQTYSNLELLILDNASSDKTIEVLKSIQVKDERLKLYVLEKNLGAYAGLNFLLEKAKGSYIAINDHDDIWHSEKLERQIIYLEKHVNTVGCGSAIINWYEEYEKGILRTQPKEHTVAWHTSLVYRNEGYRYDTTKTVGTDFYFMQNKLCGNGGKLFNFTEPYVLRRIWKGQKNLSSNWMKKMKYRDIFNLEIPFFDKCALLNRKIVPAPVVEWILINVIHRRDLLDIKDLKNNILLREFLKFVIS